MGNSTVLKAYTWIRSIAITGLLVVLFLLNQFTLTVQPYDVIDNATKQMTRSQAIVKDVLVLAYRRDKQDDAYTTAASELQGIMPTFQQEENYLATIQRSDLQTPIAALNADYAPMVGALKIILPRISQPIDPLQVDILLQHEHDYLLGMNQIIIQMIQDLDGIDQQIITISDAILIVILGLTIANVWIMVVHARNAEALHTALTTPPINPITTARNEEV